MSDDLINTYLGPYRISEVIGRGGMATVYRAYQPSLNRDVAIKVLPRGRDPQFVARFEREAQAIARLQHQNILQVYDYGEQDNLLYLVLQYIEKGNTLNDLIETPMAPVAAFRLIGHLLNGLDYAHRRGVIHRDIKPGNILMPSPTWPMLADFGIAKLLGDSHLTQSGQIIGTAAYMAPEQAIGYAVDARTDLYATGVVLYELLTGRVPFEADTPVAVLHQHVYQPPPPLTSLNPSLPQEVEATLMPALAKDPNARYQTAAEMARALEQAIVKLDQPFESQLNTLYMAGLQAFQAGQWEQASRYLRQVIAYNPDYEDASDLLEAARGAQRAHEEARSLLRSRSASAANQRVTVPATPAAQLAERTTESAAMHHQPTDPSAPSPTEGRRRGPRRMMPAIIAGVLVLLVVGTLIWRTGLLANILDRATPQPPTTAQNAVDGLASRTIAAAPITAEPLLSPAGRTAQTQPSNTATTAPSGTPTASDTPAPSDTPVPSLTATSAPLPDAVISNARLNLRGGPGERYPVVGTYTQGTPLRVLGKNAVGNWLRVAAPDERVGWMLSEFLQVNVDLAAVPVAAAPPLPTAPRPTARPQPADTPVPPVDTPVPPVDTPVPPLATPTPTNKPDNNNNKPPKTRRPTEPP